MGALTVVKSAVKREVDYMERGPQIRDITGN